MLKMFFCCKGIFVRFRVGTLILLEKKDEIKQHSKVYIAGVVRNF
jgi:hypothetical protein